MSGTRKNPDRITRGPNPNSCGNALVRMVENDQSTTNNTSVTSSTSRGSTPSLTVGSSGTPPLTTGSTANELNERTPKDEIH